MSSFYPLCEDKDFPDQEQTAEISAVFLEVVGCGITRWQELFDYLCGALHINEHYLKEIMWQLLHDGELELSNDRTSIDISRFKTQTKTKTA